VADALRIAALDGVVRLARQMLDPDRTRPIVCATIPSWASAPLLDVEALVAAVGEAADVYVLPTGDLSWELTDRLPPRLDVYGGATRIWWPLGGDDPTPLDHPLFFVHDRSESPLTIERIVELLRRRGFLERERVAEGTELRALVTRVLRNGAELELAGGERAFAHVSQLTSARGLAAEQVVRVDQMVRVRVLGGGGPRVPVTLLPFEPDRWERLEAQYREGMLVEGVVDELRNYAAFVEVFPGIRAILRKGQIVHGWVSHPEDHLIQGAVVTARITKIDRAEQRIELSCLDIPEDEPAAPSGALYPGGPPWLEEPPPDESEPAPEVEPRPTDTREEDEAPAEPETAPSEAAAEAETLEDVIAEARALDTHVAGLFAGGERRLHELRAEASQIRQVLTRDVAEARRRLLELADVGTRELVGATEEALDRVRREVEELREQLAAAEDDRRELLQGLRDARTGARESERRAERLRKDLRSERERSASLEQELVAHGVDAAERFVSDVQRAWESQTTVDDRRRYPWRQPSLGPDFLDSLVQVQGVGRERVVDVCAQVACGRAAEIAGLELHPLRSSEGGGSSQRVREDGARAWRCSLQVSSPSARRLHYWQLPGGAVELAKIVYHDDMSIR
jgi:predicted RNA-binding protein with RPS1 domain